MRQAVVAAFLTLLAAPAAAVDCDDVTFDGRSYTFCAVNPAREELRMFLRDEEGEIFGNFSTIEESLGGRTLAFAMNGGMYHDDRDPVGLYIEDGEEVMRLVTNAGPGNFGLLPNGLLCIEDGAARVWETLAFEAAGPACRDASQSGPMLVIGGELHPKFLPESTSRFIRNGVGTNAEGTLAVFVISNEPVTFYEFARLYRDYFELPDALYIDGKVSRLHAPQLGRSDFGFQLGPIVGVVE